jgi:cytochrome c oxidase cbb3-type subunit 3
MKKVFMCIIGINVLLLAVSSSYSQKRKAPHLPKAGAVEYMSAKEWRKAVFTFSGTNPIKKGSPKEGKYFYFVNCATCHGVKGNGKGPAAPALDPKPRDHTDGSYMNKLTDQQLFDVVDIGGPAMNKSVVMPNWGDKLTKKQIWDVVAFMRTLAVPKYTPAGSAK